MTGQRVALGAARRAASSPVDAVGALGRLETRLREVPRRFIACSGGIDSLVLSTVAHGTAPGSTVVCHAVSPAVPPAATARVVAHAEREGWRLELVRTGEFDDERYLANPSDRCFFCKSHLYDELDRLAVDLDARDGWVVLSGANTDDLGEYRPGLRAAAHHGVRHPYVEAGLAKAEVRGIARHLRLDIAELPASPCLASRLYTGTRVTPSRLRAVDAGEELIRELCGIGVVRCRVRDDDVLVEVPAQDRPSITDAVLGRVELVMRATDPAIVGVRLDDHPYRSGRAVAAPG